MYLKSENFESARDRMRAALRRFAAHHGVSGLYHETLTCFWLQQVESRLDRGLCLSEQVRRVQEQLTDKNLPYAYYSKERLGSAEARAVWVQPDLNPGNVNEEKQATTLPRQP